MPQPIPHHLKKYIFQQTEQSYTPEDQAVWRYIMCQLTSYLSQHAHSCYMDGLVKTGIDVESIPRIDIINKKFNKFGWGAIPVSGFIPPAAFMEFQSLGYLPIAAEMRTIEHILYTPAPDIVHEAAGHAPILINPSFANYLKEYAQVAKKALSSKEDLAVYEAVRYLSDIKEHPDSTPEQIQKAESHLEEVNGQLSYASESALLARMNWWTAEYGLIGSLESPKIFGAGLLSSIGEAQGCLQDNVKKIPLSMDCINYSYDITRPQPQLFVARDFEHLCEVLHEFSETMAFKKGGIYGLQAAQKAKTINTVELDSGLQISGVLSEVAVSANNNNEPVFIKTNGPTQLSFQNRQLPGHHKEHHNHGYSSPLGPINGVHLNKATKEVIKRLDISLGQTTQLRFDSGIALKGTVSNLNFKGNQLILVSFTNCHLTYKDKTLFAPDWGFFDLAIGSRVTSVFNGPADDEAYGEFGNFPSPKIPQKNINPSKVALYNLYQTIRDYRNSSEVNDLSHLYNDYFEKFSEQWLPGLEIFELFYRGQPDSPQTQRLKDHLTHWKDPTSSIQSCIQRGLQEVLTRLSQKVS